VVGFVPGGSMMEFRREGTALAARKQYALSMIVPDSCRRCGYDLRGTPWAAAGRLCPECGSTTPLGEPAKPWPVRRPFALDSVLLSVGPGTAAVSIAAARYGAPVSDFLIALGGCASAVVVALSILWLARRRMPVGWLVWHGLIATLGVSAMYWAIGLGTIYLWIRC
jgi:hypothetical protein